MNLALCIPGLRQAVLSFGFLWVAYSQTKNRIEEETQPLFIFVSYVRKAFKLTGASSVEFHSSDYSRSGSLFLKECLIQRGVRGWKGTTNLTVVPLYDFNVVLGIEFLEPSRLYAILWHLRIMDEGRPYMIPTVNVKTSVPTLSALQLVKGVKKGEKSFVAALVGDEENGSSQDDFL